MKIFKRGVLLGHGVVTQHTCLIISRYFSDYVGVQRKVFGYCGIDTTTAPEI